MHITLWCRYMNTCWGSLLFHEWEVAPLVCHCHCWEVDSNNCVVCLPTWVVPSTSAPLDTRNMSYFQTRCASLPNFPFFHSSPPPLSLLGSCMWVRDGLWMESSTDSGQALHPPHRYSALIVPNVYFHCDFFSPLVPFLCLTCIPSPNLYGWLDNFTRLLTPKGPQRGGACSLIFCSFSLWLL